MPHLRSGGRQLRAAAAKALARGFAETRVNPGDKRTQQPAPRRKKQAAVQDCRAKLPVKPQTPALNSEGPSSADEEEDQDLADRLVSSAGEPEEEAGASEGMEEESEKKSGDKAAAGEEEGNTAPLPERVCALSVWFNGL